jgi:hypothetical protein
LEDQVERLSGQFDHVDPNRLKSETDIDHFDLMMAGLDLGLAAFAPEELADCFDALCPCGKVHDPENLSELRKRIDRSFPPPGSREPAAEPGHKSL